GAPFTDHPFVATIPAERATWEAERTRLAGVSDPAVWGGAGKAWQDPGRPPRARDARGPPAPAQPEPPPPARATAPPPRRAGAGRRRPRPAASPGPRARPARPLPPPGSARRRPREAAPGGCGHIWADRPGAGGAAAAGRRADQRPDRRRAVHQPQDRQRARD